MTVLDGSGEINQKGVDHYNIHINALLANGIEPYVTLYPWDLPQALQDRYNGWLSPQIVKDYAIYAETCFHTFAVQGYDVGLQAPGRCSILNHILCRAGNSATEPYIVGHNVLLSHATAVDIYRKKYKSKQKEHLEYNWMLCGMNRYQTQPRTLLLRKELKIFSWAAFKGLKPIGDRAASIWLYIVPHGMRSLMNYIKQKYGNPLVIITENGMDDSNNPFKSLKDSLKDEKRIKYHHDYLANLLAAIKMAICTPFIGRG